MKNIASKSALTAVVGSALGLVFSAESTYDFVQHLDRQLHEMHCSIIPGVASSGSGDSPCRAAMYSAYSALFRGTWWGGLPLALLALGVYAFLAAFAVSLVLGRENSSRGARGFFGVIGLFPLVMTIIMAVISIVKLGAFCRTCVGMYIGSIVLAAGCAGLLYDLAGSPKDTTRTPDVIGARIIVWLAGLGAAVIIPALIYIAALPDYGSKLGSCGKLPEPADQSKALSHVSTLHPVRPVTLVADPLCPTCKSLHQRLADEGALENLDLTVALFPLDSACNWMVDRSVHPGACMLSKAVICSENNARAALDWIFDNQESLAAAGKQGEPQLRAMIRNHFGADADACLDSKMTKLRLNNVLQYLVNNRVPVSTPQMYLGDQRVCDEDTDLGLRYALVRLAPEVLR